MMSVEIQATFPLNFSRTSTRLRRSTLPSLVRHRLATPLPLEKYMQPDSFPFSLHFSLVGNDESSYIIHKIF